MTIKNFNDLVFTDHGNHPNGVQAKLDLGNGLEISVVSMKDGKGEGIGGLYGNAQEGTYEVAVFQGDKMLPLSPFDQVLGYRNSDDLTTLMGKFQGDSDKVSHNIDCLHLAESEKRAELGLD